jgi:hypothetical protein
MVTSLEAWLWQIRPKDVRYNMHYGLPKIRCWLESALLLLPLLLFSAGAQSAGTHSNLSPAKSAGAKRALQSASPLLARQKSAGAKRALQSASSLLARHKAPALGEHYKHYTLEWLLSRHRTPAQRVRQAQRVAHKGAPALAPALKVLNTTDIYTLSCTGTLPTYNETKDKWTSGSEDNLEPEPQHSPAKTR